MDCYIVTGASRGLGDAIAERLLQAGNCVFAVARTPNPRLRKIAENSDSTLYYDTIDLSDPEKAQKYLQSVFERIIQSKTKRLALVNNAGMLKPIGPLGKAETAQLQHHIALNLLTPMLLSSVFISETSSWNIPKTILNISSGASFIPYKGWSAYCATKAGIDMMTRVAGLEQADAVFPVKIFALAPGIVETDMQSLIRETDEQMFPDKDTFIQYYEKKQLQNPEVVAQAIAMTLFDKHIDNGEVLDIDKLKRLSVNKI